MSVVDAARRLAGQRATHRAISVYLDLDPEHFATPPARASQIRSLLDGAARSLEQDSALAHDARITVREDLERIRQYLLSREPPFKGSRGLAIFCSGPDQLFEVVQVTRPVEGRVAIEPTPYIEPLIRGAQQRRWCVALVNRRDARVLCGAPDQLEHRERLADDVHGRHDQGGWSQANYQRSVEEDADQHLRRVADALERLWRRERFDRLALGGPAETVPRLEALLSDELRSRLSSRRVEVDVGSAGDEQIRRAVAAVVEEQERARERAALDALAAGIGTGGRGAGGTEPVLEALNERRVQSLLLETGFDGHGCRCPACGLLTVELSGMCPADGTKLEEVEHLREAAVEAALLQDAEVVVVEQYPDLGPFQGIGALLRF